MQPVSQRPPRASFLSFQPPAIGKEERARVEAAAASVEAEPLRVALERLGTAVAREAARRPRTKA